MLQECDSWGNSVVFSPNRQHIGSGHDDGTVRVWNASTGENTMSQGHQESPTHVASSLDGPPVVFQGYSSFRRMWNTNEHLPSLTSSQNGGMTQPESPSITFSFDYGSGWLCGSENTDAKRRRLCWIPINRRPSFGYLESRGYVVGLGSESGVLTILSIAPPHSKD
jgi:WD40 repeat protein